jgi:hypothetical protein
MNKQNYYLLLAFLQSGSVPELDMHESKHFLPGQFVHSGLVCHVLPDISGLAIVIAPSVSPRVY